MEKLIKLLAILALLVVFSILGYYTTSTIQERLGTKTGGSAEKPVVDLTDPRQALIQNYYTAFASGVEAVCAYKTECTDTDRDEVNNFTDVKLLSLEPVTVDENRAEYKALEQKVPETGGALTASKTIYLAKVGEQWKITPPPATPPASKKPPKPDAAKLPPGRSEPEDLLENYFKLVSQKDAMTASQLWNQADMPQGEDLKILSSTNLQVERIVLLHQDEITARLYSQVLDKGARQRRNWLLIKDPQGWKIKKYYDEANETGAPAAPPSPTPTPTPPVSPTPTPPVNPTPTPPVSPTPTPPVNPTPTPPVNPTPTPPPNPPPADVTPPSAPPPTVAPPAPPSAPASPAELEAMMNTYFQDMTNHNVAGVCAVRTSCDEKTKTRISNSNRWLFRTVKINQQTAETMSVQVTVEETQKDSSVLLYNLNYAMKRDGGKWKIDKIVNSEQKLVQPSR